MKDWLWETSCGPAIRFRITRTRGVQVNDILRGVHSTAPLLLFLVNTNIVISIIIGLLLSITLKRCLLMILVFAGRR